MSKVVRLVLFQYSTLKGLEDKSTIRRDLYAVYVILIIIHKASKKVVRPKPDQLDRRCCLCRCVLKPCYNNFC